MKPGLICGRSKIRANGIRSVVLLHSAVKIIKELKQRNIDFLLLKGIYFAFQVYPYPGLRPMADIDFLIKREDLNKIDEILMQLGYMEASPMAQRIYGCDFTFCHKNKIYIDIHWDLCQYERFKGIIDITVDFWKRACEFSLDGIPVRTLSTEDQILYIALHHSLVHLLTDKKGIYDLFYLINSSPAVEWKKIIDNANKYGLAIPLYYILRELTQETDLKLPDFLLYSLRPPFLKKFLLDCFLPKHKNIFLCYLCQSLMVDGFLDTLRVLKRTVTALPRSLKRSKTITFRNTPVAKKT